MICVNKLSKKYTIQSLKKGHLLSYEKKVIQALQNVSFSISDGESVGYVGLNGSGKSTTIKLLAGILCPDYGEVQINGRNPFVDRRICYEIGVVFGQKQQLWMDLPVGDSFEMLRSIYNISRANYCAQTKLIDSFLDFSALLSLPARKLSLGQRMKCEFAASLLHSPQILLLDEPTIGVDIHVRKQILALLHYLQSESGTTIFLTTHNLSDIEELCNRIILLNDGKVCYDGSKERISELSDQLGKIVFRLDKQISLSECRRINTDNYSFTVNESGELCATYPVNQPGITVKIINHVQSNFRIKSLKLEECKLENIIDEFCKTDSKPSSIQI